MNKFGEYRSGWLSIFVQCIQDYKRSGVRGNGQKGGAGGFDPGCGKMERGVWKREIFEKKTENELKIESNRAKTPGASEGCELPLHLYFNNRNCK